ncbi:Fibroblast growth factor receptor-like 1 [Anabarilius grahami]|uniref:Fibroblast growth factor receptor-like 1 n=1 Tax=Anabarilius grahami TaxID=495550 RepID=A0A3N0YLF3_ANAGA|nr:Fibroblast growth factor receptor-like 1 [Anabarilius grahami]
MGRTIRLPCPVEGDPPPLVLWVKDGRNVNPGWSRYKVLKQSLKIKEVELEDAGKYICRVTNGFGSLALNFTLIVIAPGPLPLSSVVVPDPAPLLFLKSTHTASIVFSQCCFAGVQGEGSEAFLHNLIVYIVRIYIYVGCMNLKIVSLPPTVTDSTHNYTVVESWFPAIGSLLSASLTYIV